MWVALAGASVSAGGESESGVVLLSARSNEFALPRVYPVESLVTCHLSLVTCHLSLVTCHLSLVTCHLSLVICHLSFVIWNMSPGTWNLEPET